MMIEIIIKLRGSVMFNILAVNKDVKLEVGYNWTAYQREYDKNLVR